MSEFVLLAGNTVEGFVNYFREFIGKSYGIYIKGASGVGKSTFMREVESKAEASGYKCCHVPCSSDVNSYDMVRVFGLNICMIDATSPHIFEPICYGIDGEIYDIGRFIDNKKLCGAAGIVKENVRAKAECYHCMYNELKIVRLALDNIASLYMDNLKQDEYKTVVKPLLEEARGQESCYDYHAFTDYIDVEGYHDIRESYVKDRQVVSMLSRCEDIAEKVLEDIAKTLDDEGISYTKYHSILHPNHLTAIATKNMFFSVKDIGGRQVDLSLVVDNVQLHGFIPDLIKERGCVNRGLERASRYFKRSREAHEKIEEIYIKAVDFDAFEQDKAEFVRKIFD